MTARSSALPSFRAIGGVIVRFIEWMPLEEGRTLVARGTVVPLAEIVARLQAVFVRWFALPANHRSETACRYTFEDGVGRNRNYCAGVASVLRALQPDSADL